MLISVERRKRIAKIRTDFAENAFKWLTNRPFDDNIMQLDIFIFMTLYPISDQNYS